MLDKIKQYWQQGLEVLVGILAIAFLFERSKAKSAEAVADNEEVIKKLNEGNKQLSANEGKLESEEAKRSDIQKEVEKQKQDDSQDPTEFLKKR